ncbi:MAG: ABC transporter ATP-binding protein [Clostridia bacterium]|nr:ABC transporter ATP-binding protein [Clostridia bacterium]
MAFIEFHNVNKKYKLGELDLDALSDVSFDIEKGEICTIVGPSGAGKTTVLNILGGMDTCDTGNVIVDDREITTLGKRNMTLYRRRDVGFVFQFYNLVQNLTAYENIELVAKISQNPLDSYKMLELVGLQDRAGNFPAQLSGGEQQRISIARALVKRPKVLLCDEPTGALDYETGIQILKLLQDASRAIGMTVIIITHNQAITPMANRVITMRSGKIHRIEINETPVPVERIEW